MTPAQNSGAKEGSRRPRTTVVVVLAALAFAFALVFGAASSEPASAQLVPSDQRERIQDAADEPVGDPAGEDWQKDMTEDGAGEPSGQSAEEESGESGDLGGACPEVGIASLLSGGLGDAAVDMLVCMLSWSYENGIRAGGEEVGGYLAKSAFGLPAPEGEILARYEQMVSSVKPGILVGMLALGVMMMVQSANYNVAYASQHGLPKLVFAAGALVFFPDIMRMVSELSGGVATGFVGEAELGGAMRDLIVAGFQSGGPLSVFMIIGQVAVLLMAVLVVVVAALKNVLFALLFIVGPLAMILSVVPGMGGVASAWVRGVLACAAIPLLYSVEVTIGSWAVRAPEMIFGAAGGLPVFKILVACVLLWLMWKTPFAVLGWAFHSYSGPNVGSGMFSQIAKGVAVSTITRKLAAAAGGAAGGPAGAAAGAAAGGTGASLAKMQGSVSAANRNLPTSAPANFKAELLTDIQKQAGRARAIRGAPSMVSDIYSYDNRRTSGSAAGGGGASTGPNGIGARQTHGAAVAGMFDEVSPAGGATRGAVGDPAGSPARGSAPEAASKRMAGGAYTVPDPAGSGTSGRASTPLAGGASKPNWQPNGSATTWVRSGGHKVPILEPKGKSDDNDGRR